MSRNTGLKILTGMLLGVTAVTGTAFAIPKTRSMIYDAFGVKSEAYKKVVDEKEDLITQLETTQKELEITKSSLNEKQSQVDSLTLVKTGLENQIIDLNSQIVAKDTQITNLNNQLTAKQQELDTQTAYLETCQTKASEIKSQIESLTQEDVIAYAETISTLQEDLEAIQIEIVNVENNINTLNATITNLNSNIETLTQEKQDLQNQVNTLTQTLAEKETEINNLNAEITSLNNQITSLQEQVEALSNSGVSLNYDYYDINCFQSIYSLNEDSYNYIRVDDFRSLIDGFCGSSVNKFANLNVTYGDFTNNISMFIDSFNYSLSFKLKGVEKTKDEISQYLETINSDSYLQLVVNLSSNKVLTIDIVDFPLTGKYVANNNSFIDFDKKIGIGSSNVLDFKIFCGPDRFSLRCICQDYLLDYTLEIISDTEISIDGVTYTKVTETEETATLPDKFVGVYTSPDDVYELVFTENIFTCGSNGNLSLISINDNVATFESVGDIVFTENEDGTISFEFNGNTYTKQAI